MPWNEKHKAVFEAVLAGDSAQQIAAVLDTIPERERQDALCAVCSLQLEIASNSQQHGAEVAEVLSRYCPLFVNGVASCLIENREGW
jgi:hypothetical protein